MITTYISGIESLSKTNEELLATFSSFTYVNLNSEAQLIEALQSCDVFWFRLNHKLTRAVLENSTCRYIMCAATGLDHIDLDVCREKGITVISLKGESEFLKEVRATAEHTLGLILSLIRRTKNAFSHVERGNWNRYIFQGGELYKKKVGILGMGRLGKIVADYYHVMGMQVFYYDIEEDPTINSDYIKTNSIQELFESIDILSIHLSYTKENHFIIHKDNLKWLPSSTLIVNTARGGLVNEQDLLDFIKRGEIKGYATDVLYGEPDIQEHPLVVYAKKHENVMITPHIAGNTFESIEKTETFVLNTLKTFLNKNEQAS